MIAMSTSMVTYHLTSYPSGSKAPMLPCTALMPGESDEYGWQQ